MTLDRTVAPKRRPIWRPLVLAVLLCLPTVLSAQDDPPPASEAESGGVASAGTQDDLPSDINIEFSQLLHTGEGDYQFSGPVTVTWRDSRIQADAVTLRDKRYLEANGNVLIVWGGNRIFGTRLTYDLEEERGTVENAIGQVENDFMFWAKLAEKIGDDVVHVTSATVTTCTQPSPYWSFSVTSATIRINHYARLWNARMRARKLPFFYLPYFIWPVKRDRAAGLLMPEIGSTSDRGNSYSQQVFIPLGRSADLTLLGKYFSKAGFGMGGEVRFIPNSEGAGAFNGFYIDDQVAGVPRYRAEYRQTQKFRNGFRMLADINWVSDFDYFSDYERELNLVSSPTILARLEFSRNGPWTSLNVRELRREQLFSDQSSLIQQTLPEVEWRGRNKKLGRTPFYLAFESSLASIQQRDQPAVCLFPPCTTPTSILDANYHRVDAFPTITVPLSPVPWMDISPRLSYRWTYWTQRLADPTSVPLGGNSVEDSPISRGILIAGLEMTGPRINRIYGKPDSGKKRYKHTIEPQLSYGYATDFDRLGELVLYDEVDRFTGTGNQVFYGIVQRVFAQRPRTEPLPESKSTEAVILPDGTKSEVTALDLEEGLSPLGTPAVDDAPLEPVEIASLEFRQSRSFDRDVSFADLDGDGDPNDATSPYSPVEIIGRYNPIPKTSLDLRSTYNILYHDFSDLTISGGLVGRLARIRFSLVHRNGLGVVAKATGGAGGVIYEPAPNDTQVRLTAGLSLMRGKLQIDIDGSYDAHPSPGQAHVRDKHWRVQYRTQCCTFMLERLSRNFATLDDRDDFYFRVDLKGVGKLLDFNY